MQKKANIIVIIILITGTLAVFWQVTGYNFINYDDIFYIIKNPYVREGISLESVKWAFTSLQSLHWHPLTWLSHMLDVQLFGLNAKAHHSMNLLFHIFNTLLMFIVFRSMTGSVYKSGLIAALFAVHPLHVETVAWVSDRKDLVCAFFWLLTMAAYIWYTRQPGPVRYIVVALLFILGLMAKPMLVTLPIVLLLIDFWPLRRMDMKNGSVPEEGGKVKNRIEQFSAFRLVSEKILLMVPALMSAGVTVFALKSGHMGELTDYIPRENRITAALFASVFYIWKMVWPWGLATPYPPVAVLPVLQTAGIGLLIFCVTLLIFWYGRKRPFLITGWLWYVIAILPVSGLTGPVMMANRYTYIPLTGLFIIIVWGGLSLVSDKRFGKTVFITAAGIMIAVLMICSWFQVRVWKSGIDLFSYAIRVTENNSFAHTALGSSLYIAKRDHEALEHFNRALAIRPTHYEALNGLGLVLVRLGRAEEAVECYRKALKIRPGFARAHKNMGLALIKLGKYELAEKKIKTAIKIAPHFARAYSGLGKAYHHQGRTKEAIAACRKAIDIMPDANGYNSLGIILDKNKRWEEAGIAYNKAIELHPEYEVAHYNLGNIMIRQGNIEEAVKHYKRAISINPNNASAYYNMGIAFKKKGRDTEAIEYLSQAVKLNPTSQKASKALARLLKKTGQKKP